MAVPAPANKTTEKVTNKPVAHPKYSDMIVAAIGALKEHSGSSRQSILKYIVANYKMEEKSASTHLKVALKRDVSSGALNQVKGSGASGSFKINKPATPAPKEKVAAKEAAKKGAVKTAAKKPVKEAAKTPVKKTVKTPVKRASRTPVKKASNTPVKEAAKTPVKKAVKTPVKEAVKTPVKKAAKTPVKEAAKTPVKKAAKAPVKKAAKKPAAKKSAKK